MKKAISVLLCMATVFTCVACGSKDTKETRKKKKTKRTTETEESLDPSLTTDTSESETEETLTKKILAVRSAFGDSQIILECQMPLKTPTRRVACAMLNLRRRMPQSGDFS